LSVASNAALQLGTGDFTVEFWIYPITLPGAATYPPMLVLGAGTANTLFINFRGSGTIGLTDDVAVYATTASPLVVNNWYHIAVVRSSGSSKIYTNGVGGTAVACATNFSQNFATIGYNLISAYLNSYLSNLRIVKGTAVYTANFTPPTAPVTAITNTSLLLNMANAGIYDAAAQNNTITVGDVQASTTQKQWGTTSMKYDGTGDYLTIPTNPSIVLGTADFTIEGWVYFNTVAGAQTIFDQRPSGGNGAYPVIYMNGATMVWYVNTAGQITSGALSTGVWYYFAVTRASSVTKMFINGSQVGSNYTDTNTYLSGQNLVGIATGFASGLNGYLQDFRITRGVARTVTSIPTAAFPTR
jgi:hypothetical protein